MWVIMYPGADKWGFPAFRRSRVWVVRRRIAYLAILLTHVLGAAPASAAFQVVRISDGDTLTISTGEKIRFLQIDTPEISPAECYGAEAHKALISLIGKSSVTLESDSVSDDQDQFGRILRYVKVGKTNLNLKLVQIGAATPYFYQGEKGKYATQLLKAAKNAKAKKLGLWKMCPNTKLEPLKPATTGAAVVSKASTKATSPDAKCDPNYQGCIPPYPPDLDCTDIKRMGLAPIRVIGTDVHKFDGDGDGIGCDK
jgi:endonuclease YncB( thermonuclease family)